MVKRAKFPLDMGNDVKVRSIEELKENFNAEKVTEYFLSGKLLTWLEDRHYDEEAEQVRNLSEMLDKQKAAEKLPDVFEVEINREVNVEAIEIHTEKLKKLREITSDDEILKNADFVAFSQEDLSNLLYDNAGVIYLCGEYFCVPLSVKNVKYIGLNDPTVTIICNDDNMIDLKYNGIDFENCEFSEETKKILYYKEETIEDFDEDTVKKDEFEIMFDHSQLYPKLKKYNGKNDIVEIPNYIGEIGDNAFKDCKNIKKIIIPDSVTKIGESAFMNCENLININIPNGIFKIEEYTFCGCKNLTSIDIPNSVIEILDSAFAGCESLVNINIPPDVRKINCWVFQECYSLESIIIPSNVTAIDSFAFDDCKNLKNINLPNSVTEIEENSFIRCEKIKVTYRGKTYSYNQLDDLYDIINY